MRIRIDQLVVPLDYKDTDIVSAVARKLRLGMELIVSVEMVRRSVDARRRRGAPVFILAVEVDLDDQADLSTEVLGRVKVIDEVPAQIPPTPPTRPQLATRPVVVGAGPAGLMAALTLAEAGLAPLLIDRGLDVAGRSPKVGQFWSDGVLDEDTNVLFGAGGAGLFSDGKLTTRSKDRRHVRQVLETLVACGAPDETLVDSEPHLGSDILRRIVPAIVERIVSLGGEVSFARRLDDIEIEDGRLRALVVGGQRIEADWCVLATGHSARDVYRMLVSRGVAIEAKPFAVGVRMELPQSVVDRSQWGSWAGKGRLGPGSFRLTRRANGPSRACYSFCMCPGGRVIACASAPGEIGTNGMSLSARGGKQGNAGFLVPAGPADFGAEGQGPQSKLAGMDFQLQMERKAFELAGGSYQLPAQRAEDFLAGRASSDLPAGRSCERAVPVDLAEILPQFVSDTLRAAIPKMLQAIYPARPGQALLYGPETRTSAPVTITRDAQGQSPTAAGLLPAGEGGGHAGGIVSSAIDGIKAAEALIKLACPSS